ncbi:MAG: glycosyltransferase family 2 protein [Candidatus Niyogibacteria bacterium]|nr:MAG: glycosyltransferase family 2 protein [Candidatus Niyogibacteria bacterium]
MVYPYLHIASHKDLIGRDRVIYRALEILPGFLSWGTLGAVVFFSWASPVGIAIFIIIFDVYWLIKTFYLSFHLRVNWKRLKRNLIIDWEARLQNLKWDHVWQMVILPMYKEDYKVVAESLDALLGAKWPKEKMIIVLAAEERARPETENAVKKLEENYSGKFGRFLVTWHPVGLEGEISGKGSNTAWASREVKEKIIDAEQIPYENILVSSFDIDTQVYPQYFLCLTYNFLVAENPYRSSYQPVPIFNNNIWNTPAFSRVVATSGTFWQMMQQERPERLSTFSSHSMSFKMLVDVGFWQKNMVSEDSRIFWNAVLFYDGDYEVMPLAYPVSMDANVGRSLWQTMKQVYKQQRRWAWGVENVPYLLFGFLKNKKILFAKKLRFILTQLEGFWSLATNPILIFILGWLPLVLGGDEFNATLLSYNLPRITRILMTIAMLGLVVSAIISTSLLPPRPAGVKKSKFAPMILQWLLIPFTIIIFGAIPGLDSQARLALGKPLGFWVTPKIRKTVLD